MSTERLRAEQAEKKSKDHPSYQPSLLSLQRTLRSSLLSFHPFVGVSLELLSRGFSVRFRAPGDSMRPVIRDGERITVKPVEPSDIIPGDIILYRYSGSMVAHRVVRIEKKDSTVHRFILRGDALGASDEAVGIQQILGKVVSVERSGRSIDPYSRKARITRKVHLCASRLKRWAQTSIDIRFLRI